MIYYYFGVDEFFSLRYCQNITKNFYLEKLRETCALGIVMAVTLVGISLS